MGTFRPRSTKRNTLEITWTQGRVASALIYHSSEKEMYRYSDLKRCVHREWETLKQAYLNFVPPTTSQKGPGSIGGRIISVRTEDKEHVLSGWKTYIREYYLGNKEDAVQNITLGVNCRHLRVNNFRKYNACSIRHFLTRCEEAYLQLLHLARKKIGDVAEAESDELATVIVLLYCREDVIPLCYICEVHNMLFPFIELMDPTWSLNDVTVRPEAGSEIENVASTPILQRQDHAVSDQTCILKSLTGDVDLTRVQEGVESASDVQELLETHKSLAASVQQLFINFTELQLKVQNLHEKLEKIEGMVPFEKKP